MPGNAGFLYAGKQENLQHDFPFPVADFVPQWRIWLRDGADPIPTLLASRRMEAGLSNMKAL